MYHDKKRISGKRRHSQKGAIHKGPLSKSSVGMVDRCYALAC